MGKLGRSKRISWLKGEKVGGEVEANRGYGKSRKNPGSLFNGDKEGNLWAETKKGNGFELEKS